MVNLDRMNLVLKVSQNLNTSWIEEPFVTKLLTMVQKIVQSEDQSSVYRDDFRLIL